MQKVVKSELLAYVHAVRRILMEQTGVNFAALQFDLQKTGAGNVHDAFVSGRAPSYFANGVAAALNLADASAFDSLRSAGEHNMCRAALTTLCSETPEFVRDANPISGAVYRDEGDGRILRISPFLSADGKAGFEAAAAENAEFTWVNDMVNIASGTGSDVEFTHVSSGFDIEDVIDGYLRIYAANNAIAAENDPSSGMTI
jgi:hypothetical protein